MRSFKIQFFVMVFLSASAVQAEQVFRATTPMVFIQQNQANADETQQETAQPDRSSAEIDQAQRRTLELEKMIAQRRVDRMAADQAKNAPVGVSTSNLTKQAVTPTKENMSPKQPEKIDTVPNILPISKPAQEFSPAPALVINPALTQKDISIKDSDRVDAAISTANPAKNVVVQSEERVPLKPPAVIDIAPNSPLTPEPRQGLELHEENSAPTSAPVVDPVPVADVVELENRS